MVKSKPIKKFLSLLLSLIMLTGITAGLDLSAYAYTSGDFEYDVLDDGTAEITGYAGSATVLEIPSEIDGYTVTSIGDYAFAYCESLTEITIPDSVISIGEDAFSDCTSLTEVTIPDSVISIGGWAFYNCTNLTEITIPDSVTSIGIVAFKYCTSLTAINVDENNTAYSSQDGVLFNKDKTELIQHPASNERTSYIIPDSVTSIGDCAFEFCTSLTDVIIPDSVTSIGDSVFRICTGLTNVTIGNGVTSIGSYAFEDCTSLTEVTIPENVTSIGEYAFYGCRSLTEITIPDSVISIGDSAFGWCDSLIEITIGSGVTSIGEEVFYVCRSLTAINVDENNTAYSSQDGVLFNKDKTELIHYPAGDERTSYIIPDTVISIEAYAFEYATSLTEVTIPDSVTSIGDFAFELCWNLENITIGNNVMSIGIYAFSNCSSLVEIVIPDSVTSIGDSAFSNCTSLANVIIGNGVTSIGGYTFGWCDSLIEITIGSGVTSISNNAFYDTAYYNDESNWEDGVLYIGEYLIEADEDISGVYEIKQGTKLIADSAFNYCTSLTEVTIPDSVTSIGSDTFFGCYSLTDITIPDSVTSIGEWAFAWCESLTEITIPDSVISIGEWAFAGCTNLKSVTIGNGVTSIDYRAFYNTAYYNDESNWEDGVLYIGEYLITASTSISGAYEIKQGTKLIANYAFEDCESLTEITIPDSVTSIGVWAFYGTAYYKNESNWEDGVLYIGEYLIKANTDISGAYEIKQGTKLIADYAFEYCNNLTEITIPDSVTYIGEEVFYGCDDLTIYGYEGSYAQTYANENDIPFVALTSLADEATGVVIMGKADNALPEGAEIVVELTGSTENSVIYDITLLQNGEEIQPGGAVTVKIPVPENMDGTSCKVYRQEEDGTYTDMNAVYQNGYMVFTTDHFSEYVLTTENLSGSDVLRGDVTGDGIIDAADVVMVQRYDAGLITLSAEQLEAADVTGDGIVDAADVVMIQRYDAGLITSL